MTGACPCGSDREYVNCCQPFHLGGRAAGSPEQLMRSRYTAFVMGLEDYIQRSWHPHYRPQGESGSANRWLGLRVLSAPPVTGNTASVEFVAFYLEDGSVAQLHERSSFVHEDGHWLYTEGDMLAPIKLGRNEACCCGSGRKQKRCHPDF